jgi:hypothetical protein
MTDLLGDIGRAAARWLLWSPRRLWGFLGAGLFLVALVASCAGSPAKPAAAPSPRAYEPSNLPPRSTYSAPAGPTVAAAAAFVEAWASHQPTASWYPRVSTLSTARFAIGLKSTDPANVPATKVTGGGALLASTDGATQVYVPTDAGPVTVTLVSDGSHWLADGVAPLR